MNRNAPHQQLYWSVSRPIKYLGFTIDEWFVGAGGVLPGLTLVNFGSVFFGLSLCFLGIFLCWSFKKYKRLSSSFKLKSYLVAKGFLKAPSCHPKLLNKNRVGR